MIEKRTKYKLIITPIIFFIIFVNFETIQADSNTIIISLYNYEWPPTYHIHEDYTSFDLGLTYEIDNLGSTKTISTGNSCLLYPYLIVDIEGYYGEYEGLICAAVCTNHSVQHGKTSYHIYMYFEIHDYNKTIPSNGKITLWSDLNDDYHPYVVEIIKTTIFLDENGMIVDVSTYPLSYPELLSLISIFLLVIIFRRVIKKL